MSIHRYRTIPIPSNLFTRSYTYINMISVVAHKTHTHAQTHTFACYIMQSCIVCSDDYTSNQFNAYNRIHMPLQRYQSTHYSCMHSHVCFSKCIINHPGANKMWTNEYVRTSQSSIYLRMILYVVSSQMSITEPLIPAASAEKFPNATGHGSTSAAPATCRTALRRAYP